MSGISLQSGVLESQRLPRLFGGWCVRRLGRCSGINGCLLHFDTQRARRNLEPEDLPIAQNDELPGAIAWSLHNSVKALDNLLSVIALNNITRLQPDFR